MSLFSKAKCEPFCFLNPLYPRMTRLQQAPEVELFQDGAEPAEGDPGEAEEAGSGPQEAEQELGEELEAWQLVKPQEPEVSCHFGGLENNWIFRVFVMNIAIWTHTDFNEYRFHNLVNYIRKKYIAICASQGLLKYRKQLI